MTHDEITKWVVNKTIENERMAKVVQLVAQHGDNARTNAKWEQFLLGKCEGMIEALEIMVRR